MAESRQSPVPDCDAAPIVGSALTVARAAILAQVFTALSDPVRLRLLSLIASHAGGEVCECDLTPTADAPESEISHQVVALHEAGLITSERRGAWVYHKFMPEGLMGLSGVLH
jgi:ArsR family transcriptional regulator